MKNTENKKQLSKKEKEQAIREFMLEIMDHHDFVETLRTEAEINEATVAMTFHLSQKEKLSEKTRLDFIEKTIRHANACITEIKKTKVN